MQVPHLNSVMFANGQEAYLFNLQNLKWSSPAQLNDFFPGNIVSGVVTNRTPYVTLLNGSTFTLYEFDNGSTDTLVTIVTPDIQPNFAGRMNILGLKAVFRAANTGAFNFSISTDFSSSFDKTLAHTAGIAGMQTTGQSRWYLPRREAFALTFSGHQTNFSNDAYLSKMMVYGTVEESLAFPDVTPPTPPTGLSITGHTDTTVTISFTPGTDR
jgi:hypothetical protein